MAKGGFGKGLRAFTVQVKTDMRDVFRNSTEELFKTAQTPRDEGGNMPVLSGDLRASLSVNGSPNGIEAYEAPAKAAELGDVVVGTWEAPYAMKAEFGGRNPDGSHRPGNHFVGSAASQWSDIVKRNAQVVKK